MSALKDESVYILARSLVGSLTVPISMNTQREKVTMSILIIPNTVFSPSIQEALYAI